MTFWETVERGEYVMIALAVILIAIVVIWAVRGTALRRKSGSYVSLMPRVRDHVAEGDLENARLICDMTDTPGARMICAGVKHIGRPINEVREAMKGVKDAEKESMFTGVGWLKSLAVISPLLGFGGTLIGIIDRLRDMGESEIPVELAEVCGELAPTFVTTVAGLGVGIFAVIAYSCLYSQIFSSNEKLERLATEFTDLLNEPS